MNNVTNRDPFASHRYPSFPTEARPRTLPGGLTLEIIGGPGKWWNPREKKNM